jgi:hypothetical protein
MTESKEIVQVLSAEEINKLLGFPPGTPMVSEKNKLTKASPFKVFCWTSYMRGPRNPGHHSQASYLVAAKTKKQAAEIAGTKPSDMWNCSTHTDTSAFNGVKVALAKPETLLWRPLNDFSANSWFEYDPKQDKK